jgi:four helix bundle protein
LTGTESARDKAKTEIVKAEIDQGRISSEFRERTKQFAAATIRLHVKLPKMREEVRVLGKQLLRSGTSVAAQIRKASRARSDEEFVARLGGALQDADESALWLELLRENCGIGSQLTQPLEAESYELLAMFTTMIKRTREKSRGSKSDNPP